MGNTNKRIEIDAVIKTTLQGFDSTIKDLQSKLKSGALSMDLTKGIGKDLSKLFANFETGFSRLKQLTPDGFLNIGDSQEFQKEGKNIIKTIQEISRIAGDLGTKNLLDAKKLFPSAFDSRTSDLLSRINQIDAAFQTLGRKQNAFNNLEVEIKGISARLQEVENLAANKDELSKTFQEASQAAKDTTEKVQQLREQMSAQIQLKISSESFDKVQTEVTELEGQLSALTKKGVTTGKGGKGVYQGKGVGDWEKALKSGTQEEKAQASAALELLRNYNKINQALKEQQKLLTDMKKLQEISSQPGGLEDSKNLKDASKILGNKEQVAQALDAQAQAAERAAIAQNNLNVAENANTEKAGLQEKLAKKTQQLAELKTTIDGLKGATDLGALTKSVNELTNSNFQPVKEDLESMAEAVRKVDATAYEQLKQKLSELGIVLPGVSQDLDGLREGFDQAGDKVETFNRQLSEVESLKQRIAYFFGLSNSIQLFKRAVTSAMNTVKELDATMTEAAVVTEFSIGDMWEKLPEYSKNAQDLGVSINGMYQATTLYYQQGLKTNEAMQLGVETMKMARIASMDSTEATKAMTAALRGFNMELNETSATKVNDVYSQLAAVTAADTNQIATAMEKTASIAASANMEFETTAALLAQIIETTQEAPETAGTAMKTIIARFAEVKSLRDQGLVSGEDEEGELIDVNKIQTALRTVGISMEGFFAGTEGLDSILLKLSQKWDTLDFETQRYIATMAAGSRQQSRFIAMMSDYGRTTELVSEAQNSAGASQKQFEKTQDSLATSLTRLDNAWDEFLMGLANNEALKFGVDVLTKLLETINKVTDAISGGNGLAKSVVSLVGVMGALTAGKGLLNGTVVGGKIDGFVSGLAGKFGLSKEGKQPGAIKAYWNAIQEKGILAANKKMVSGTVINKDGLVNRINSSIGWQKNTGAADGMKKLVGQLDQGEISANKAAKKFEKLGGDIEGLSETGQVAALDLDDLSRSLSATGTALIGAGMATSLLASAFESWGLEEQAEKIQKLSGVLMGAGTALSAISSILPVLTGLTWEQAAATLAAYWPIAAIAVALAVIIHLWVVLAKRAKEASLEGRMEAAAEATERAKKEAEAANEAYNELLSAKEGYDELQTQLDELTKGTLEWKKALADSNAEVLELLETYPELAQYLTRGEHGELEISEAGWGYMEEYSSQALANAQTAVINSQIEETRLKISKLSEDFSEKTASLGGYNWIAIRKAYEEGGVQGAKDEIANRGIAGEGEEEAWRLIEAYEELKKAINSEELALQAQTEALLQSQVAQETFEYEFGRELISGMATGYSKRQQFFEMEKADELLETNDEDSLRELYAEITGQSIEQIKETFGNDMQELAKEIAKILGPQEWAKEMDQVAQAMSKLDTSTQRAYSVMLSGDISGATQGFQTFSFEDMARSLGLVTDDGKGDAEKLKELFGLEGDNFDAIKALVDEAFAEIRAKAAKYDFKTYEKDFGSATVKQLSTYADMMLYSTTSGGKLDLQKGFDQILAGVNDTQRQQILSMMSTYDFTKEGAGESFVQDLRDIGVMLNENSTVIQEFIKQMDMVNAIFRDFDLSDVYDEVKRGLEEAEEIADAEYLSFEQYEKYMKEGLINAEDWTWNGKGWVNVENGMADLVQALKDNTLSNYNLTVKEAKQQKSWYEGKAKDFGRSEKALYTDENGQVYVSPYAEGAKRQMSGAEMQAYLAQEGIAESIWKMYFATEEEYKRWGELFKGGFADLETFLTGTETFDPTNAILDAEKAWENPYDKFYNTIEKINAELREREKLERAYQRLLKDESSTAQNLLDNSKDQLKNLGEQKGLQQYLMQGKQAEINDLVSSSNLEQYATFEDGMVKINWKEIEAANKEKGQEIEDYISKLEELRDQYQDAEDALLDIEDQIDEIVDQGKQEYLDLENQIKEAIINARQEEIDKLTAINDTIASTNDKILNSMRESVDYQRQMRDNQKTEEDLAKKQERLAYLKQDSSGAHALEILALEEEISQQQEDYTDSLIDQKISELERQNEEAKQQRQEQIDVLKEQLTYEEANGLLWKEVKAIWEKGVDETGLVPGSNMETLLKNSSDWKAMSAQQKADWAQDLNENIKAAWSWEKLQTALASDDENLKAMINEAAAKATVNLDDHTNKVIDKIDQLEGKIEKVLPSKETQTYTTESIGRLVTGEGSTREEAMADAKKQIEEDYKAELARVEKMYKNDPEKLAAAKFELRQKYLSLTQFKTGGLADFTGPAWLDGTKSRPEYILNADQTQAFFKLIDVLGSFNDLGKTAQNSEENTYDIDINVESVGSDYDVERIAEKVKDLVLTSARYRNNNIL